jgi:hypothetical protein
MRTRRWTGVFLAGLVAIGMGGCAHLPLGPSPGASPQEKEALLRERITAYWGEMIRGDWGKAYEYHDPFFRVRISREGYIGERGLFVYHTAEIAEMDLKDNIADVKVKINFEIPRLEFGGKTSSKPREDRVIEERWLWIYDHWYKEYIGRMDTKFILY